jgi:threonine dehydrogenase-like Zn-dependent dehydrogenase
MSEKVKAVVMVAPGKVEVQQLPYPDHLEPGAAIVKMEMSGICGTDKHAYRGEVTLYGGTESEQDMVYPAVHGQPLKVGDRVTNCPNVICGRCWYCRNVHGYPYCAEHQGIGMTYYADRFPYIVGGWGEYMYLPPKAWVYKVPEYISVEYACLVELFVVAALLDRAKDYAAYGGKGFHFGDTVVIQGAGAIGMMMIAKARLLGAGKIIALDPMDKKLELSKEFGADVGINISKYTDDELVKYIRDETAGRGADVVVETVGRPEVLKVGLEMLCRGGTYMETGNFVDTGSTVELNVHRHIAAKNVLLFGNTNHPHDGYYVALDMMWRHRHAFPFEKLITHRYKYDQAQEAMKKSFEEDALKVVFTP